MLISHGKVVVYWEHIAIAVLILVLIGIACFEAGYWGWVLGNMEC